MFSNDADRSGIIYEMQMYIHKQKTMHHDLKALDIIEYKKHVKILECKE